MIIEKQLIAFSLSLALEASKQSRERCESGQPECGPVEHHDSEGVPLCKVCWDGLLADSADEAARGAGG